MKTIGILALFTAFFGTMAGNIHAFDLENGSDNLEIHGFISQGFLKSDRNNFYAQTEDGTSQFNEFGINFRTELTDRLSAGLQLFSRDLGQIGNNNIEIDWAYGDYRWKDWLGVRAGLIKLPWGFYNETRDLDMLRTSIFLPSSLYAEEVRDAYNAMQGIDVYGSMYLESLGSINYQFVYGEQTIDPNSGMARSLGVDPIVEFSGIEVDDILGGSLEWNTPLDGLRLGGAVMQYDWDLYGSIIIPPFASPTGTLISEELHNKGNAELIILSVEYIWENLLLAAEYIRLYDHEEDEEDSDNVTGEGYYGGVSYRFTNWFELGAYYSVYYPDIYDKDGKKLEVEDQEPKHNAWQKDLALTARFDINNHWTFKLEGHFVDGTADLLLVDNPEGLEEKSFLFAFKTTVNF